MDPYHFLCCFHTKTKFCAATTRKPNVVYVSTFNHKVRDSGCSGINLSITHNHCTKRSAMRFWDYVSNELIMQFTISRRTSCHQCNSFTGYRFHKVNFRSGFSFVFTFWQRFFFEGSRVLTLTLLYL